MLRSTNLIRSPAMWWRGRGRHPERLSPRLISVMYHGVPARARPSFSRQLAYIRSLGEFVSPDQAVELLKNGERMDGRFFCVTVDDGEQDAYRNAVPILAERDIPAIFFIVPDWASQASRDAAGQADGKYLDWDQCRQLVRSGIAVGSHSLSHRRLSRLDRQAVAYELQQSKLRLEAELGTACAHFACPWGQPGDDYVVERDPALAAASGYRSFFTTIRGGALPGTSRWAIPRVRLEPEWGLHQLRYLFCRSS